MPIRISDKERRTTLGKAVLINQDPLLYGTFAEIGAGQEVARYFFHAGRASQTIAKTISAYDMSFSDEIYGKENSGRYVCESRLIKMLDKEFSLLERRLKQKRGNESLFFAFANTVATSSDQHKHCHGWVGFRFQTSPNGPYNDAIMHVRMLDRHRLQQQEIIGILGVNLIFASCYKRESIPQFLDILTEDIKEGRLAIDLIRFSGTDFEKFDNNRVNLELLRRNLSEITFFTPEQKILYIGDELYGKALFIERGSFHPFTNCHLEIINKGLTHFSQDYGLKGKTILPLLEINLQDTEIEAQSNLDWADDILNRIEMVNKMGYHVIASQFKLYFQLKGFLRHYTNAPLGIAINATLLEKVFSVDYYKELSGGLLEGLGLLLDQTTKLYVYPHKSNELYLTSQTLVLPDPQKKIFEYFTFQKLIQDISNCEQALMAYHSKEVQTLIQKNDPKWEKLVPELVCKLIKEKQINQSVK
jgi:hypothetical protein